MSVYVDCVGCEQRKLDAQRLVNCFRANGAGIVSSARKCNHAVLVTCAVDSSNEERSLSMLDAVSRELPEGAGMYIGGCLPSISPGRLSGYHLHGTFSPRTMGSLDAMFNFAVPMDAIARPNRSVFDSSAEPIGVVSPRQAYDDAKAGFKVVIDDGCLMGCSYCVIKRATGSLRSMSAESILAQIKDGISRGEKTIMLMGGDAGAYGKDIGTGLQRLLSDILAIPSEFRLFIHDFNVNWLIRGAEEYLRVFSSSGGRKIGAICFPIQSGSDRILALMKRGHTSGSAAEALKQVRSVSPGMGLGTHVIIGFPSEADADFAATMGMLEYVGFDFITCFPYSEHALAGSAALAGKVGPEAVEARFERISSVFGDRVKIVR